jgi:hypothetical protein
MLVVFFCNFFFINVEMHLNFITSKATKRSITKQTNAEKSKKSIRKKRVIIESFDKYFRYFACPLSFP